MFGSNLLPRAEDQCRGSKGEAGGKQFTERRGMTRTEPCPEKNSPVNVREWLGTIGKQAE